ncbi:hypothetical protein Tco_0494202 [Tanacetum coccineum]
MNYLEEQTDGEVMVAQMSLVGTTPNVPPPLKDKSMWTAEEKKIQKFNLLARSLLIQGLPNDIYSLIDSNDIVKELWDALERQMRGSEYDEQDRKAASLYEYETFKATEGEKLLDTYLCYLQVINDLKKYGYKKDNCDMNDASGIKKKAVVVVALDPLALVAEKTKVIKGREKVVVHSEESDDESLRRESLSKTIRFTGLGSEEGFSRAIRIYFGDNHDTFSKKLSYNIDHLQKHIEKEYLHKGESRNCFTVLKTQFETFFTLKQVDSPDHKDQVEDQILKESFQKYTGKELQTYRRELLYYMDALELHMGRRALHESECMKKEQEVRTILEIEI